MEPRPGQREAEPIQELKDHIDKKDQYIELFRVERVVLVIVIGVSRDLYLVREFVVHTHKAKHDQDSAEEAADIGKSVVDFAERPGNS